MSDQTGDARTPDNAERDPICYLVVPVYQEFYAETMVDGLGENGDSRGAFRRVEPSPVIAAIYNNEDSWEDGAEEPGYSFQDEFWDFVRGEDTSDECGNLSDDGWACELPMGHAGPHKCPSRYRLDPW